MLVDGMYPALTWIQFLLAGIVVGRSILNSRSAARVSATAGTDRLRHLLWCCVVYFHHHPDGLCCSVVPLLRARSLGSRAVRCNKPGLGSTTEQVNGFVDRSALNQHAYSGEEWHISATSKECDEGTTNRDLADLQ